MATREEIIDICKRSASRSHQGGAVSIFQLETFKGLDFYDANHDTYRGLCVGLSMTMLHPGMNAVQTGENAKLWDAIGKKLIDKPSLYFGEVTGKPFPPELSHFRYLFATVLKTCTREWILTQENQLSSWKWFRSDPGNPVASADVVSYLVYPLLETVTRFLILDYIDRNGLIIRPFQGRRKSYTAGGRCSSLADLLFLVRSLPKFSGLKQDLDEIFTLISSINAGKDALSVIYEKWRNPSLHGETSVPTATGVMFNITLLIAMEKVKSSL